MEGALAARNQSPFQVLTEAALGYAGAEEDEDFAAAREQLRRAAVRYVQSLPSSQRAPKAARARPRPVVDSRQLSFFRAFGLPADGVPCREDAG